MWLALQRELVTVDGHLKPGEEELPALAVAEALLLLGVPPEELR